MTANLGDDGNDGDDLRQRVRDQVSAMREAHGGNLAADSPDDADFTYLFDPGHVLVSQAAQEDLEALLRRDDYEFVGVDDPEPVVEGLLRYALPRRRDGLASAVPDTLDVLQRDLEAALGDRAEGVLDEAFPDEEDRVGARVEDLVTPDHFVHITPVSGSLCPATEPEETGLTQPWPPVSAGATVGAGVVVSVVDTGWHPAAAHDHATWWLAGVDGDVEDDDPPALRRYAGHGTFIAGVVRCMAPAATVYVDGFLLRGGAILESRMVDQLERALDRGSHVINLSAGCRTRHNRPPLAFRTFYRNRFKQVRDRTVLVAAAGNDASPEPFWPASFPWATGVGSIDRDGRISRFSNFSDAADTPNDNSVDVYALGRNVVNAFPNGTYVCGETPSIGDVREFTTGLARWSGTSFSAPIVAGLIAAQMAASSQPAPAARNAVVARGDQTRRRGLPALLPPYRPVPTG